MPTPAPKAKATLDPNSPTFDSADQAATALADSFKAANGSIEKAGVLFQGPDNKYRYSTSIDGLHDNFALAAQIPQGHKLAGIVHIHPGEDSLGQVFSPNDLDVADRLKLPSYVRFLNDGSTRKYLPGQTKTQSMAASGSSVRLKVARGDPLSNPPNTGLMQAATPTATTPTTGLLAGK